MEFQLKVIISILGLLLAISLYFSLINRRELKKSILELKEYQNKQHDFFISQNHKIFDDINNSISEQQYKLNEIKSEISDLQLKTFREFEPTDSRYGVQTIYMDYKILEVSDLGYFLSAYSRLYDLIYKINIDDEFWENVQERYKSYPEDILQILSAHTGNSIIFRTKTGWLPSIGTKDGDVEVALPKGAITLVFIGYLLQGMISYGISNYKDLLEIEHINLENEKAKIELKELRKKTLRQPEKIQNNVQTELKNIYDLTIKNPNIKKVEINQSPITRK